MNNLPPNTVIIDAQGKPCPMPLLMLKRGLKTASTILLKASDPHSQNDVVQFCKVHHIRCTTLYMQPNEFHYLIET